MSAEVGGREGAVLYARASALAELQRGEYAARKFERERDYGPSGHPEIRGFHRLAVTLIRDAAACVRKGWPYRGAEGYRGGLSY